MGKSGTRFGIAEDVCIEDEICILIFDFLARYKASAEGVLTNSATFRMRLQWALKSLAIDPIFKPYCLRRGGAMLSGSAMPTLDALLLQGAGVILRRQDSMRWKDNNCCPRR